MNILDQHIPLRLGCGPNAREHHHARAKRVRLEREAVAWVLEMCPVPAPPLVVTITRSAPSKGLDLDNLAGACKAVRDEIAKWLGIDDASPFVAYRYAQCRGEWGVFVSMVRGRLVETVEAVDTAQLLDSF